MNGKKQKHLYIFSRYHVRYILAGLVNDDEEPLRWV